jgi:hypothetical protein
MLTLLHLSAPQQHTIIDATTIGRSDEQPLIAIRLSALRR